MSTLAWLVPTNLRHTWLITLLGHVGCPGNIPATADGALCKANCSSGIVPTKQTEYHLLNESLASLLC